MDALLVECTKEKGDVIRLLLSESVKTSEMYRRMAVHDDNCMSQRKVDEWLERLGEGLECCCWYWYTF
jgi:hypothetical protein